MLDHPQLLQVDATQCQACSVCAARKVCRVKAIRALDPGDPPFIDGALCHGCRVCMPACPFEAIVIP